MAKVRVQIVEREGEFTVEPPVAVLAVADKLKLFNTTREDLVFRVESAIPFGAAKTEVIKAESATAFTVPAGTADGQFAYQILMIKSGKKAKGNSDPVIIIDNP